MSENNKLFAEEKIGKLLLRISLPIIMAFLVSELYNMVDTIFVGRNVGAQGIGALVMVFPIQRILLALSVMIAVGTSTAFARANGQNDVEQSRKVVNNGFSLSCLLMISITVIVYFFSEKILLLLGASPQILPYAQEYLSIIIFGATFLSLTVFISDIMVSFGNNKVALISTSIGALINIFLDYIFVVHWEMGIKGAAIATTISQIIGFLYAYYHYVKVKEVYKIPSGLTFNKQVVLPIILVGLSAFVMESDDGILMGVQNHLLFDAVGDNGIIVLGVVSKVYMFLFITMFGMASAMQPIAAYNVGAKNYKRLQSVIKKTSMYAFITSVLLWIIAMVFAPQLMAIFVEDAAIIRESVTAFRIMIAVFPVVSIYYVAIFYLQAMGKAKASILMSVLKQLMIMLPLAIILVKVFQLGAVGVWLSYPLSDIVASLSAYMLLREEEHKLNSKVKSQTKSARRRLVEVYQ
jgi:putative MATE family efflux protein